ncbi:Bidirectional sugar transporter SWEET6b like [Actinidia chinensis var. chinensis]|uniref:Bidirectional sugar transporter SWEET6b like n=1 Tax=Actinidia chinensis var. chinensis TaxID=1590841 RepID=A0A2R6RK58_ACTCC|nr:Bidirectional sugar transporter SWEET6b like [Actinidia chinensis var. chinensis]
MVDARFFVGLLGNVTSFFLFAAPMTTFWRILKNKSVEEFKPDPYIAGVMNCIFWVFYALPLIHPHSTLVITINSIGLFLQLCYLSIFMYYGNKNHRTKIVGFLILEVVVTAIVAGLVLHFFHTHTKRSMVVGIFCICFGAILYFSPLTVMKKVVQTKSVEFMPIWLSVAAFSNGLVWSVYALLQFDAYILIGNSIGAVFGAIQLILYGIYWKSTPKKGEKNPEVQLQQA